MVRIAEGGLDNEKWVYAVNRDWKNRGMAKQIN